MLKATVTWNDGVVQRDIELECEFPDALHELAEQIEADMADTTLNNRPTHVEIMPA